jgi:poly(3-hydroxybutyrate) depolymerase
MRKLLLLLLSAATPSLYFAQTGCGNGRYSSDIFSAVDVTTDITYGQNVTLQGQNQVLKLDFYEPNGDVLPARPLVVMAHGGNFIGGAKDGTDIEPVATSLAKAGYTVASIEYRLGVAGIPFPGPTEDDIREAVLRAVHDMKAAVRFFYKDAATANVYHIDTNRIFVGGASAGAVAALHYAYLDDLAELPAGIDTTQAGLGGGLPGLSGNPGYSDRVVGVVNLSGALDEATWIQAGDEKLVSTHAVADNTVPYGTGQITFLGFFQLMVVDGSSTLAQRCTAVGIDNCLYSHQGASVAHVPHNGSPAYLDTTMVIVRNFLTEVLCQTPSSCQYTVANTPAIIQQLHLGIHPNPAQTQVALRLDQSIAEPWDVRVIDPAGRIVREVVGILGSTCTLQRGDLPAGFYLIEARTQTARHTQTLIFE